MTESTGTIQGEGLEMARKHNRLAAKAVRRLQHDATFAAAFRRDPHGTLGRVGLSAREIDAITSGDEGRLAEVGVSVGAAARPPALTLMARRAPRLAAALIAAQLTLGVWAAAAVHDGRRIAARAQGRRVAARADGRRIAARADGRRIAARADGRRIAARADGRRIAAASGNLPVDLLA